MKRSFNCRYLLGTWKINVNGTEGSITIGAPTTEGVVSGSYGTSKFEGFWDEVSQTISLNVRLQGAGPSVPAVAIFKGFLFRTPSGAEPGSDLLTTLTGFVQVFDDHSFSPAHGSSRRNVFGWVAQIPEVI
jgi:hypothetical protein